MNNTWNQEIQSRVKIRSVNIRTKQARHHAFYVFGKRLFDIIVSLAVVVFLLSWLIPILAIFIKLDSKGSVFFLQKRVGAFGKTFYCIKLRTMVKNAMANVQQAGVNDPRITRVGKVLRYSYLDELPQFINVLVGDMSIVGPRPHMISDCFSFSEAVPDYNRRHLVKPGVTGLAQVKGYRGKVNSYFDVTHRFRLDMFYINKACFLLDIKLIFQTFAQIASSFNKLSQNEPAIEIQIPATAIATRPVVKKVDAWYENLATTERQSA